MQRLDDQRRSIHRIAEPATDRVDHLLIRGQRIRSISGRESDVEINPQAVIAVWIQTSWISDAEDVDLDEVIPIRGSRGLEHVCDLEAREISDREGSPSNQNLLHQ